MARVVIPGCPHHVTHRGNLRCDIFLEHEDRILYKSLLGQCARQFGLEIWAFCAMTNHIHLIAVPRDRDSLGLALGRAHQRYASVVNARHLWTGHLWANRYFSTPLDHDHLWTAVKYVELNPVRAGIVKRAEEYVYSSAACHSGLCAEPLLSAGRPFPGRARNWTQYLADGLTEEEEFALRTATYTGRPCGSSDFVAQLEAQTGGLLAPRKRGRKPKEVAQEAEDTHNLFDEM